MFLEIGLQKVTNISFSPNHDEQQGSLGISINEMTARNFTARSENFGNSSVWFSAAEKLFSALFNG